MTDVHNHDGVGQNGDGGGSDGQGKEGKTRTVRSLEERIKQQREDLERLLAEARKKSLKAMSEELSRIADESIDLTDIEKMSHEVIDKITAKLKSVGK